MIRPLTFEVSRSQLLTEHILHRLVAALLTVYCIAQVVTIVTRIASGADLDSATGSMAMIQANHAWYMASKIANLVAAFLLLAAAVLLYQTFRPFDRALALLATSFLATAAFFWLFSSLAGLAIAENLGSFSGPTATYTQLEAASKLATYQSIEPVRAIAGRVGFTAAALALAFLSVLVVLARPISHWFGWAGLVTAVAMLFIWDPEASLMHRLGGGALLAWFLALAGRLALKGVDIPGRETEPIADDN